MILKHFAKAALAAIALATTSCIQSEENTVINPDGSGKFKLSVSMDMAGIMGGLGALGEGAEGAAEKMKDMDPMKEMIQKMVKDSQGVDVWSEAKVEKDAAGKSTAVIGGYFHDASKLKLDMGAGKEGGMGELGQIHISKDKDGNLVFDMSAAPAPAAEGAPKADVPKLTDAEYKEKLEMAKAQIGMMKGMMEQMMASAKMETTLNVPGTIVDFGCFEKVNDSTAKITIKPAKMAAAIEKLLSDPVKGRVLLAGGEDPMAMLKGKAAQQFSGELMASMIGREGAPKLVVKPGATIFDYAKESEAAKANQSQELKDLISGKGAKDEKKPGKVKLPKAA